MRNILLIFLSLIGLAIVPFSAQAEPQAYFGLVLGSTPQKGEATQVAKKASAKLQIALADETLKKPLPAPHYLGLVVQVVKIGDEYQVLSFLRESEAEAKIALAQAQKFFPQAKLQKFTLDVNGVDPSYQQTFVKRVLILASEKDYSSALQKAKKLSAATGIPYWDRGLKYKSGNGLAWPEGDPEDPFSGTYIGRRDNLGQDDPMKEYISVEMSDAYPGFTPKLYLVVAGVFDLEDPHLNKLLEKVKKSTPDAYAKATVIYMGCME